MYKLVSSMNDETMYRLTRQCFDEMRANGITSVGEFHYFHHSSDGLRDYAYDKIVIQAAVDAGTWQRDGVWHSHKIGHLITTCAQLVAQGFGLHC